MKGWELNTDQVVQHLLGRNCKSIDLLNRYEHWRMSEKYILTPASPVLAIVREHMPLQASQNRIS
jgi:hypothetical protein